MCGEGMFWVGRLCDQIVLLKCSDFTCTLLTFRNPRTRRQIGDRRIRNQTEDMCGAVTQVLRKGTGVCEGLFRRSWEWERWDGMK